MILFLSNSTLIALEYRKGQMHERCRFSTDARYVDAYCEFVEGLRNVPTSVLVDIVAEEFAHDTMARVGWRDRALIVERALERHFARTAYRSWRVQGRSPDSRSRNQVLLAGLTNTEFVARWVTPLVERNVPLRGVYSVPFVQQRLVRPLRMHAGNRLLVSIQDHTALRLSLFVDGQLMSSRLALIDDHDSDNLADYVVDQIGRSREYLMRGRLLGFTDHLDVDLICNEPLCEALQGAEMEPRVTMRLHTPRELARSLPRGARLVDADRAELLYASVLVGAGNLENYARPGDVAGFRALRTAGHISSSALAASLLCVVAGAWQMGAGMAVLVEQSQVDARVNRASEILARERELAARPGYRFAELREARTLADHLAGRAIDPFAVADIVSAALADAPAIEIDTLTWTGEKRAGGGRTPAARAPDGKLELTTSGRVVSFEGEFPGAFARIEAFMTRLRADPRVLDVRALRMPINVDIGDSLSGDVERLARNHAVGFELVMEVEPGAGSGASDPPQVAQR